MIFQKINEFYFPKINSNSLDTRSIRNKSKSLSEKGSIEKHLFKNKKMKYFKKKFNEKIDFGDCVNLSQNKENGKYVYNSKSNFKILFNNNNDNNFLKELFQKIDDIKKNKNSIQDKIKENSKKINQFKEEVKDNKKINDNDNKNVNENNITNKEFKKSFSTLNNLQIKKCNIPLNHCESYNQIFSKPKENGEKIEITSKKNHKIISNIMDTTKNQIQNDNNQNQNSSDKYSSYFYSSKPNININKIINKVIDENKKANIFRSLNYFDNIGKNFANHLKTRKNFYVNKNENSKDYFKDNNKKEKKTLNSLKIIILSPFKWKKHEEIWSNILQLSKISKELHKYLLPPNDNDVIISSYLKLFPKVLNFCSINNKLNATNKETDFISFYIDDNIANPKKEIKNWKMAYKQVIFRWHPDKLNAILNEINLDENIKNILFKKSTIIINNMNKIFKSILEILNKIIKNKTIE